MSPANVTFSVNATASLSVMCMRVKAQKKDEAGVESNGNVRYINHIMLNGIMNEPVLAGHISRKCILSAELEKTSLVLLSAARCSNCFI